eukprot:CAMPEP_0173261066 /NCGR_PEP_ID=MMETSP1142-20121109/25946_1 /TAXON_ID=483371 /ORGANISM="non described non described, Strain CCMP2298" /LENGTH=600 /DNA_ID=CAMNT_0014195919 /DNA_START=86 /DNA_END=1888 /DNA_ORIENTATION=+
MAEADVQVRVRVARPTDLPVLRVLIRESFAAMSDHYGEMYRPAFEKFGEECKDLQEEGAFAQKYSSNPANSCFWVASVGDRVVGSVAVERKNAEEFNVVRMAVDPACRGRGIGKKLLNTMLEFCKEKKAPRVVLVTGNPSSARFYSANGFQTKSCTQFTFPKMEGLPELLGQFFSMVRYIGVRIVRRVAVVGGTHGNERLGVNLVQHWQRDPAQLQRSTLQCTPLLANPPAIVKNVRYIDTDLNRQFPIDKLAVIMAATADPVVGSTRKGASDSGEEAQDGFRETVQGTTAVTEDFCAARLNALLGPKTLHYGEPTGADFIIDLHSSTSNLGLMLILSSVSNDCTSNGVANYLDQQSSAAADKIRIASIDLPKASYFGLDSLAPSGMAIEVGPLAHGSMDCSLLEHTRRLVLCALDYLEERNLAILTEAQASVARADASLSQAQSFDFASATFVPVELAPNSIVPQSFPEMSYFHMISPVSFPSVEAEEVQLKPAAEPTSSCVADKLSSSLEQVRTMLPRKYILHKSLDRQDWAEIKEGAPFFQAIEGSGRVVPFTREEHAPSEGSSAHTSLYPVFINEAAYQGNNMAFWVTKDAKVTLY